MFHITVLVAPPVRKVRFKVLSRRDTEDAFDLCDAFFSFSPQGKASLHEISKVMGMPGKPDHIDGSEVHGYFLDGNEEH
jgi:hypothetical protein